MRISDNGLLNLMSKVNSATICTIAATTIPKMNKRGNPLFGRVIKVSHIQMQFGYDYENAVNNRLKGLGLEPTFDAMSRSWGRWVVPNKIAENKGEFYLRFYTMANPNALHDVSYLVDGRMATEDEVAIIKEFTPKPSESARQAESGLVEHQVQPRVQGLFHHRHSRKWRGL